MTTTFTPTETTLRPSDIARWVLIGATLGAACCLAFGQMGGAVGIMFWSAWERSRRGW